MFESESPIAFGRQDELAVLIENVRARQKLLLIPAAISVFNLVLLVVLLDHTHALDRVDLGIALFASVFLAVIGVFLRGLDAYRLLLAGNATTALIIVALLANGIVGSHAAMLGNDQMPWFLPYFILSACSFFSVMLVRDATHMAAAVWLAGILLMIANGVLYADRPLSAAYIWVLLALLLVPPVVAAIMLLQRRIHGATARALVERQHELDAEYRALSMAQKRDPETGVLTTDAALEQLQGALDEGRELGLLCIQIINHGPALRAQGREQLNAHLRELVGPLKAVTGHIERCARISEDVLIGWLGADQSDGLPLRKALEVAVEVLAQCAPWDLELRITTSRFAGPQRSGRETSATELIDRAWEGAPVS